MNNASNIKTFTRVIPMMYAYNTPGIPYHEGWTKIGYTEKQSVQDRIKQQTHTAGIRWELAWQDNAMFKDGSGEYFTDHDFHDYLVSEYQIPREPNTEWFQIDGEKSQIYFNRFAQRKSALAGTQGIPYTLRKEQAEAVRMTREYFENGGTEFLWNAKPRFGKTLTAYDLIQQMHMDRVLIVTNRPSIANSWADDFRKFIAWRDTYAFVSDTDALSGQPGIMARADYVASMVSFPDRGMIAFESLQGLKGSVYFGGEYDKLKWIKENTFDLLIVDESQEGVDTMRTDRAFRNITRSHTLYLSGTPFKALADGRFNDKQIFNWSYADEQEAKDTWDGQGYNPYEALPRLNMLTYQLSNMIYDTIQRGLDLSGEDGTVDYAFDLNEFFLTNESGRFLHEPEIRKFLKALSTQEKYPYSTPELRKELSHTLWLLNRVASAKALSKLLKEKGSGFEDYEVVLAAGDGKLDDQKVSDEAIARVRKAIAENDKTITLSVGQLTVGITSPEWSGVLMLCNLQSPSSYMQAAFRAQNPHIFTRDGQRYRKENAYVFDFDPARTLIIFDEFANNLTADTAGGRGTGDDREKNIHRLLNFFPVLGEDEEGRMVELDAKAVLSIPRRLKSQEVVRHGFMSNFLFQNIGTVFGAPSVVTDILKQLTPAKEEPTKKRDQIDPLDHVKDVPVNDQGEVEIPREIVIGQTTELFGPKLYEDMTSDLQPAVEAVVGGPTDAVKRQVQDVIDTVTDTIKKKIVTPIVDSYDVKKGTQNRIEREVEREIENTFQRIQDDYIQQANIARVEFERKRDEAETETQAKKAEEEYDASIQDALRAFTETVQHQVQQTIEEKPQQLVEKLEKHKAEEEKRGIEDDIRARLRGFARTIPSFIMAYGDGHLTLGNFDVYTEDDVFQAVTGITLEQFRFLRDGGDYADPETGEIQHFNGNIFDEVVFDDSVAEFWKKKQQLADYFDESQDEDIFDYVPPQKTNQIFTPRWVVDLMVDELEANNPGCFDDPNHTFADLYMKSGLYITEIVKRLYRSEKMKALIPDDKERVRHILEKQVYGMAPTRIIYLIATNYILGFDPELHATTTHFVLADAAEAAKSNTLQELVDRYFG